MLNDQPEVRVKRVEDEEIAVTRICEPEALPDENAVIVNYTLFVEDKASGSIKKIQESHRIRYLFAPEVGRLFDEAGMKQAASAEWMTDRDPGPGTFGVYFIGTRGAD